MFAAHQNHAGTARELPAKQRKQPSRQPQQRAPPVSSPALLPNLIFVHHPRSALRLPRAALPDPDLSGPGQHRPDRVRPRVPPCLRAPPGQTLRDVHAVRQASSRKCALLQEAFQRAETVIIPLPSHLLLYYFTSPSLPPFCCHLPTN